MKRKEEHKEQRSSQQRLLFRGVMHKIHNVHIDDIQIYFNRFNLTNYYHFRLKKKENENLLMKLTSVTKKRGRDKSQSNCLVFIHLFSCILTFNYNLFFIQFECFSHFLSLCLSFSFIFIYRLVLGVENKLKNKNCK